VQKSVFECWLEGDRFERFWAELLSKIDPKKDSLIAYTMDSKAAKDRRTAGSSTVVTEKRSRVIV